MTKQDQTPKDAAARSFIIIKPADIFSAMIHHPLLLIISLAISLAFAMLLLSVTPPKYRASAFLFPPLARDVQELRVWFDYQPESANYLINTLNISNLNFRSQKLLAFDLLTLTVFEEYMRNLDSLQVRRQFLSLPRDGEQSTDLESTLSSLKLVRGPWGADHPYHVRVVVEGTRGGEWLSSQLAVFLDFAATVTRQQLSDAVNARQRALAARRVTNPDIAFKPEMVEVGRVDIPPSPALTPVSPNRKLIFLIAVIIGLTLGVFFSVARYLRQQG